MIQTPQEAYENRSEYWKWAALFHDSPAAYHEFRVMQVAIWYAGKCFEGEARDKALCELRQRICRRTEELARRHGIGKASADAIRAYFAKPIPIFDGEEPGTLEDAKRMAKTVLRGITGGV